MQKNENLTPSSNSSLSTNHRKSLIIGDSITQDSCATYNYLKFRDKEAFLNTLKLLGDSSATNDTILDNFEANFSQTSLRNTIQSTYSSTIQATLFSTIMSKPLSTVLSSDSIVQIDTLAFLFDFNNQKIYELYPVNCTNISLLKQKIEINNDSTYVLEYNFYDPIFYPSGYETYTGKAFKWLKKIFGGCSDIWAAAAYNSDEISYSSLVGGIEVNFKAKITHSYKRYGVYFEVGHYFEHRDDDTKYFKNVDVSISHYDNWKVFCGGNGSNSNWPNSIYGNNSHVGIYKYQSSNSLARNHNTAKTYAWFYPFGASPSIPSPFALSAPDINF